MKKVIVTNRTFSYVLPMVGTEVLDIKRNIVNAFIGDEDHPRLTNHIFLLYEYSSEDWFARFEEEVKFSPLYVKSYDPDKMHVMIVFKIPEEYQYDYDMFMNSKYSQMSEEYKKEIQKFHGLPDTHPIMGVLYKREFVYEALEKVLNEGCTTPYQKVDRAQEAASVWKSSVEMYNDKLKIKDNLKEISNNFIEK